MIWFLTNWLLLMLLQNIGVDLDGSNLNSM